jgi:hypothetical protein
MPRTKRPVCHSRVKEMSETSKKSKTSSDLIALKYTRARVTNGTFLDADLRCNELVHRRHDNPALSILSQNALFCRCSVAICSR